MAKSSGTTESHQPRARAKSGSSNGAGDLFAWARKEPKNEDAWEAVDNAARDADSPHEAEALYLEVLRKRLEAPRADLDKETLAVVGRRAIQFLEEWYEDTHKAIEILQQLIAKDPENAWAFEKLSLLLTLGERWDDLLGTYDSALSGLDDPRVKRPLLEEAARIAKDFAGQAQRASDYLKQLLLLKPDDEKLASSLERRLEQQERYADLVEVWRARLAVTQGEQQLAYRIQIGDTLLDKLGDGAGALLNAKALLDDNVGEESACTLLERLTQSENVAVEERREALGVLRQRYEQEKRIQDAVRVLHMALDLAADDAARILLNQELVQDLLLLDRPEDAQAACAVWLGLDPTDDSALERLRELVEKTQHYGLFAHALVNASEVLLNRAERNVESSKRRIQLLIEAADTQETRAKDAQAATDWFARVLLDVESTRDSRLLAARRLTGLLVAPVQGGQRLDVLEKLSLLEDDASTQMTILSEAAELAERLGDPDRALGLWDRRLEKSVTDREALDAKVRILAQNERYEALQLTLRARFAHSEDAAERRADLVWIARIYQDNLNALAAAIDVWKEVEAHVGRDAETVDALMALLAAAERWNELTDFLTEALEQETDAKRRTRLLTALGDVFREHRHSTQEAADHYRQALELNPRYEDARAGLSALLEKEEARHSAAETLAAAYKAADEWQNLLNIVETRLVAEPGAEARQAVLLEAASLLETRATEPSQALGMVQRAFALIPSTEVEERMVGLAQQTGEWQAAVDGYQQALLGCDDLTRTTQLLYEQGRLLELELKRLPEALSAYRRILELNHQHVDAASAAIRCAGSIDAWSDAAWALVQTSVALGGSVPSVYETFVDLAERTSAWEHALLAVKSEIDARTEVLPKTAHDVRFQLALWYRDKLSDFEVAEALLRRAVLDHTVFDSLATLADIQRRRPDRDFVQTLLRLAENDPEPPLRHLNEAAHVALEQVADTVLARPILVRVLDLAEQVIAESGALDTRKIAAWCLEQLYQLFINGSDYVGAFELLLRGAAMNFDTTAVLDYKHRAAELSAGPLGDAARAIQLCRAVIKAEPTRRATRSLLASLYEQENQHEELLKLFESELALPPELARRLEVRLEIARVQGILGGDVDERMAVLGKNLDEQLGHAESIEALAEMLAPLGRYTQLYQVLCTQAEQLAASGSAPSAAALFARAGLLAEQTLDDVDGAIVAYRQATALAPDVEVLDSLASIHSVRGEFNEAVDSLIQRLELTPAEELEARRSTLVRLGNALRSAGRAVEAIRHLQQGVQQDPAGQAVRELLVQLHEERQEWSKFATLLAEGVPYASAAETKVRYLSRSAEVRWHRLGDLQGAIPLLEQARKLTPEDQALRLVLADALRQAARYDEARELLEGLLAEFGRRRTPERATVHFQLALIARAEERLEEALSELDEASGIQRSDPLILKTLGDVAREKGELERAERAYRALLLLVSRGGSAESGIGESAILFELYRIAAERQDPDRAKDLLDSAIEAADQDPSEALRLEQALREAEQWPLLLEALERRGERTTDEDGLNEIRRARADALVRLDRLEEALDLRFLVLEGNLTDASLVAQTEELAARCDKLDLFTQKLLSLAQSSAVDNPELSCELWLRMGQSAEQRGDVKAAAKLYASAQATGRRPAEVFRALWHVHQVAGNVVGMTQALETFVESAQGTADAADLADAEFKLAELELREPKKRNAGLARLTQALEREPRYEAAAAILEGVIRDGDANKKLIKSFESIARRMDDRAVLLRALGFAVKRDDTTLEQLQEAVGLAEELKNQEQLLALLERTVEFARKNKKQGEVLWALTRLAEYREAKGDYPQAVALLRDAVSFSELSERFELELRVAVLARERMKDLELAAKIYERLASDEPSDARAWKPLLEIYRTTNQSEKLESCLSRAEQHVVHDEQRRAIQLERVRLLIDAGRLDEAEQSLRGALEQDPDNDEACDLLLALFERQDSPVQVRELLSSRLSVAIDRGDDVRIVNYAQRLGGILEGEDVDAAIGVYQTARHATQNNREILVALLRLTPETDTRERADLMENLLPTEPTLGVEAMTLELARLRLSDSDESGVERAFEIGFKLNPQSQMLRERLETWYRERNDWLPLAELMVLHARTCENPDQAVDLYKQAAEIYENKLGDATAAADVLAQALSFKAAAPEILEPLSQYLLISGQGERAVDLLTEALDHADLLPVVRPVLLHLRAVVRGRMDENSLPGILAAVADLDAARESGAEELDGDLCALLLRQQELAGVQLNDAAERAAVLRLSTLLPKLDRTTDALGILNQWLDRHDDDADVARVLAKLALEASDWSTSMRAHRRLFELTTGAVRLESALRFAEACEHCGTPMDAREVLEQVHREIPDSGEIKQRLFRMYEAAGAHADLAVLLLAEAEQASENERKYALLTDAAELLLKTGDHEQHRAIEALETALRLMPNDHRATVVISKAYAVSGRIEEACAILEAAIKEHGKRRSRELSELQHAMSVVAAAAGDDDGRYVWLEAALQSDRKNGDVAAELAVVAMDRGELDGAIKALQLITLLKEDCPMSRAEAYFRQATIARDRGDQKKAVLLAKRALTSDSKYDPAKEFLAELGEN